jgi:hypothetical protein
VPFRPFVRSATAPLRPDAPCHRWRASTEVLPSNSSTPAPRTNTPMIVLGNPQTAAARFLEWFGVGLVAPSDGVRLRQVMDAICRPKQQLAFRQRAANQNTFFTAEELAQWLWQPLEQGRPCDRRFEQIFGCNSDPASHKGTLRQPYCGLLGRVSSIIRLFADGAASGFSHTSACQRAFGLRLSHWLTSTRHGRGKRSNICHGGRVFAGSVSGMGAPASSICATRTNPMARRTRLRS